MHVHDAVGHGGGVSDGVIARRKELPVSKLTPSSSGPNRWRRRCKQSGRAVIALCSSRARPAPARLGVPDDLLEAGANNVEALVQCHPLGGHRAFVGHDERAVQLGSQVQGALDVGDAELRQQQAGVRVERGKAQSLAVMECVCVCVCVCV